MARIEVVMPQMGESIVEGTIVKWFKKVGDTVKKDETLLEISTDKVDSEIPSPAAGILAEITAQVNQTVSVRTVIAYIESEGDGQGETVHAVAPKPSTHATIAEHPPVVPASRQTAGTRFYSPLVLSVARNEGVSLGELESITGTGEGGRVSKKDLEAHIKAKKSGAALSAPHERQETRSRTMSGRPLTQLAEPVDDAILSKKYPSPDHEIWQMGRVLQGMAQHMVRSVQVSPHVAAIHEVDMTSVVRHRARLAEEFERREGFKLTFTPYIVEAVVEAIKNFPLLNCSIEGEKIVRKNFINIGIAVATDNGLLVPVIKHAEERNFVGYARAVNDLATRARSKKLVPDDIQNGTFTISNYGVFGTVIGTPIINQPQVAILGTGAIVKRLAVMDDETLAVRSLAYFTLSFDHRIIDGATGGMFLSEIEKRLEGFDEKRTL